MMNNKKVYVTMTDKFMSGWGKADGKINKLVFECDGWAEAEIVKDNAEHRSEMKYINMTATKPYYAPGRYLTSWKDKEEAENWYKPYAFSPGIND